MFYSYCVGATLNPTKKKITIRRDISLEHYFISGMILLNMRGRLV
jgi:hypothetical protein